MDGVVGDMDKGERLGEDKESMTEEVQVGVQWAKKEREEKKCKRRNDRY